MDAAAKPPWTGLRRPPPPDPPRHPTECKLLLLQWPRRVQGCKPCRNPTLLSKPRPPQCESAPATPAAGPMQPAGHRPPEPRRSPNPS
ncbi:hypothetical protein D7Y19_06650 [Stenotrophomonas maltophilia]|nr:hypothetical protein [Stenotrophomonas maltophilia]